MRFPDDLWFDIAQEQLDAATTKTVARTTILDALSPRDFISFASPKTRFHGSLTGFGVLEGQPHNNVHNCVGGAYNGNGGFMQANLSPVDPLFFLHHSNMDRLWDVWTRKQLARGYPALPEGADLTLWSQEQFVFFTDSKGAPASKTTAGEYAAIGDFNYDYEPGVGEEVVPAAAASAAAPPAALGSLASGPQRFASTILSSRIAAAAPARAQVTLPAALLAAPNSDAPLFAEVTVDFGTSGHAPVALLVNAPPGAPPDPASDYYLATLAMFGHHGVHGPVSFLVPISRTLAGQRSKGLLAAAAPLTFTLAPLPTAGGAHAMLHATAGAPEAELISVTVSAR